MLANERRTEPLFQQSPWPPAAPQLVGIAKLAAEGQALADGHNVEYLTLDNRSVLTRCASKRVPFAWMINPYRGCEFGCKYCYARYTHEFMELRDSVDFESRIFVKQHAAWLLRQELKKVRPGESIAIGTATDPYQPAERKFGITRSILEELSRHEGLEIGLVTKGTLILRDLELLKLMSRRSDVSICVTVTTLDLNLARGLEPRAPRPDLRLKIVRRLNEAGVRAGVNCAPILPGITDHPEAVENLVSKAAEAGAAFIFANAVFLKDCSLKVFLPFLEKNFPHLVPQYKKWFAAQAFLPPQYRGRVSRLIKQLCAKYHVGAGGKLEKSYPGAGCQPLNAEQLSLF